MFPSFRWIKKSLQVVLLLFFFGVLSSSFASAATTQDPAAAVEGTATMGLAKVVETKLNNVQGGSAVSLSHEGKGAILSITPYDPQILGVVSRDAAILIDTTTGKNGLPVISDGLVYLLVSTQQGAISRGDLI